MPIREKHYLILERFQKAWPVWSLPDTEAEWCHTFCDGSAFMQDQPTCVLAGAAAIRVTPNTDESQFRELTIRRTEEKHMQFFLYYKIYQDP